MGQFRLQGHCKLPNVSEIPCHVRHDSAWPISIVQTLIYGPVYRLCPTEQYTGPVPKFNSGSNFLKLQLCVYSKYTARTPWKNVSMTYTTPRKRCWDRQYEDNVETNESTSVPCSGTDWFRFQSFHNQQISQTAACIGQLFTTRLIVEN